MLRTLESIEMEIQAYFEAHGKRPSAATGTELFPGYAISGWLRRWHDTSIPEVCDSLGLPRHRRLPEYGRTVESVDEQILAYYQEHGTRPSCTTCTDAFNGPAINVWLDARGTSVAKRGAVLGLPPANPVRTAKSVDQAILTYYKEHDKRPSARTRTDSFQGSGLNAWLKRRGTSVAKRCAALGLARVRTVRSP